MNRSVNIESDILRPATPTEQGVFDRVLFDNWRHSHEPVVIEDVPYFTKDDAATFIEELSPKLDAHYGWFKDSDPADVARLLNELQSIREDHINKTGNRPTDFDIYRRYRLSVLNAESQNDDLSYILDAAMNGNITDGTYVLP